MSIKALKDENVGQFIYYIPFEGCDPNEWQKGIIKCFDNYQQRAFVVYNCDNDWHNYLDYTAASTRYEDLYLPKKVEVRDSE